MLVLSRKVQESILLTGGIKITVVAIRGKQIRLGIEAPKEVKIFREELIHKDDCNDESGRNIEELP